MTDAIRRFLEEMVPHHEPGIEMARQAAPETDRAEILELAARIINAQGRKIGTMRCRYRS